jgi:hypothetical protein
MGFLSSYLSPSGDVLPIHSMSDAAWRQRRSDEGTGIEIAELL